MIDNNTIRCPLTGAAGANYYVLTIFTPGCDIPAPPEIIGIDRCETRKQARIVKKNSEVFAKKLKAKWSFKIVRDIKIEAEVVH